MKAEFEVNHMKVFDFGQSAFGLPVHAGWMKLGHGGRMEKRIARREDRMHRLRLRWMRGKLKSSLWGNEKIQ